jgi:hypothetical protein
VSASILRHNSGVVTSNRSHGADGEPNRWSAGARIFHHGKVLLSVVKKMFVSQREGSMNRRQVLVAGLVSTFAASASAQQPTDNHALDTAPVKGQEELWFLLTAMDALIFVMAVAILKDPDAVLQARREFQPYAAQLSDPKAVEALNAALKSSDGQARLEEARPALEAAAKEVEALLSDEVVAETVRSSIARSFARASVLLIAHGAENKSGWCRVYAFRKVRC